MQVLSRYDCLFFGLKRLFFFGPRVQGLQGFGAYRGFSMKVLQRVRSLGRTVYQVVGRL